MFLVYPGLPWPCKVPLCEFKIGTPFLKEANIYISAFPCLEQHTCLRDAVWGLDKSVHADIHVGKGWCVCYPEHLGLLHVWAGSPPQLQHLSKTPSISRRCILHGCRPSPLGWTCVQSCWWPHRYSPLTTWTNSCIHTGRIQSSWSPLQSHSPEITALYMWREVILIWKLMREPVRESLLYM